MYYYNIVSKKVPIKWDWASSIIKNNNYQKLAIKVSKNEWAIYLKLERLKHSTYLP
jgi:hypothetical protein